MMTQQHRYLEVLRTNTNTTGKYCIFVVLLNLIYMFDSNSAL